jgi:hypothetical protein
MTGNVEFRVFRGQGGLPEKFIFGGCYNVALELGLQWRVYFNMGNEPRRFLEPPTDGSGVVD